MQTPAAILAPKQQYLNLVMNSIYKFSEICSAPVPSTEAKGRVSMLVKMMIAYTFPQKRKGKNCMHIETLNLMPLGRKIKMLHN
jgi:hypothetical protein